MILRQHWAGIATIALGLFAGASSSRSATFPGSARVEINDLTGSLSCSNAANAMTISCWFRISVPSGVTLVNNMVILANGKDGNEAGTYSYLLQYNVSNGNVEFRAKGASGSYVKTNVIERPYLDRWYHVAVVRSDSSFTCYVDGRGYSVESGTVGSAVTTNGMSIGGWGGSKHFYGDIQEVAIFQEALSGSTIRSLMFQDIPTNSFPSLRGYYKLSASSAPVDRYKNFAPSPPMNTSPGSVAGSGTITFEETDQGGEQSVFDSRKNGGEDAIAPLSGAFSWEQTVLARPTPGIAFDLRIGYSSALAFAGAEPTGVDPYDTRVLSAGWRHTFETRMIPGEVSSERRLLLWGGGIETWFPTNIAGQTVYRTRHKEYRGELKTITVGNLNTFEWTTPDRLIYRFYDPQSTDINEGLRGRLYEIRDSNSNVVQIAWDSFGRYVNQVTDTAGGIYTFNYNLNSLLTNINFQSWNVWFQYDGQNRLTNKFITTTSSSVSTNVNTSWSFAYDANGLLNRIIDPRGNTNTLVLYDKYGRVTNTVDALNRITRTEYGVPSARQIRRTDPGGFQWLETYDRKGHLLSQTDPLTNTTSYRYDDRGNRTSITEPLGWKTFFTYDDRANVLTQINALGQTRTWTYHSYYNKPLTETDPLGWVTTYSYDAAGNLLAQFDNLGTLTSYTYTTNGLVRTATDGNGNVTTFNYNSDGFLASKIDPATNTTSYARNEVGWVLSDTNALGQVNRYSYDINGHVIQRVDPLFRTYTSIYDPNGNLVAQSDAKARFTTNFFDAANQKTQMIDRVGSSWFFAYTTRGEISTIKDPLNNVISNVYDDANRLLKVVDPLSNVVSNSYDANGNITATFDKLGQKWSKQYDRLNRVVAESDPLGNIKQTTYDAAGRIKVITTPNGYPSTHDYDGRGRLTKWVDAEGFNWLYTYDGNGNIVDIEDALNGHYIMAYGPRNERILEKNQDNFQWTYRYDRLLRPIQQTDPNGTVRTITYDDGGRIDYVSFSTGRVDDHQYDDNDNLTLLSRSKPGDPPTSSTFAYDANNRITEYTDTFGKKIKYGYDSLGRVTSLTYPDNKVLQQRFDALGRLTNQVDWASRQMKYAYDKANRLVSRAYPNGVTQTNAFDSAGRISNLEYRTSSNTVQIALNYAYDRNGNKTGVTEQGTFDGPQPTMHNETAAYTASGRLQTKTDSSITSNDFTYAYDASGNMTNAVGAGQSIAFTYDEDNRVLTLNWEAGITSKNIQNRYDALGRRISRKQDGIETRYALDLQGNMERILCDFNSSGQITAYYIHGPDLCYKVTPGAPETITCYHADAQANIIALTDGGGTNIAQYAYTPYGRSLGSSLQPQVTNSYLFVGSQGVMEDPPGSGLYFMRARYYSAETGTFLSSDPVKHIGPTWRPVAYAYANGNPLSYTDPEGESPFLGAAIGAAVGAAIDIGFQTIVEHKSLQDVNWQSVAGSAGKGALMGSGVGIVAAVGGSAFIGAAAEAGSELTYGDGDLHADRIATEGIMSGAFAALGGALSKVQLGNQAQFYLGKVRGPQPSFARWLDMGSSHARNAMIHGVEKGVQKVGSMMPSRAVEAATYARSQNSRSSTAFSKATESVKQTVAQVSNNVSTAVKAVTTTVKTSVSKAVSAVKSFFSWGKKK